MKIALDITPIKGEFKGHKVRGVGFYLSYLKRALETYCSEHEFIFFTQQEAIPKNVDLVHYPYFEPFFVTLPLIKGKKRVITVHDLTPLIFPDHFPPGIKGTVKWYIQRSGLQISEAVITDSNASKRDIRKVAHIKEEKIHVAYLAAAEEFKQISQKKIKEVKEKYSLPEKFALYVGDITWNKNVPRLMQACSIANVPLAMVGKTLVDENFDRNNPWNKDILSVHTLANTDDRFKRLGFVPTEDLVALYNSATVFVFPSVYEGFGLPILEAMQSGTPVITTRESCLLEVGGEAAYYVNGFDSRDIAKGISEVFYSRNLQDSLSEKGIKQAKKFSWEQTAKQTVAVYEHVLV